MDDPYISQYPSLIAPEFPDDPYRPTQVLTPSTEGPRRSKVVRSQPYNYSPSMIGKKVWIYHYITRDPGSASSWCKHVFAGNFLPIRNRSCDSNYYSVVTQDRFERMGRQGPLSSQERYEAAALSEHLYTYVQAWSDILRTSDGVGVAYVYKTVARQKDQGTDRSWRQKQRAYIPKDDASYPTFRTESVLLTSIFDAEENRDVVVIDTPNSFIQTRVEDKNDTEIIKLRGVLVDILCKIYSD